MRELYITLGCPLAGLTRDLLRESGELKGEIARIYDVQFKWLKTQFECGGVSSAVAREYSRNLMSSYHGSILLAYTQADASLIDHEVAQLKQWLRRIQEKLNPVC